ncbi:MAG: (Fe-S)-binding protein [Gemmatimonadaceae bacterium]|nr:(Fe-S)-binding protein [Gemmatimonadaceae bacterium]
MAPCSSSSPVVSNDTRSHWKVKASRWCACAAFQHGSSTSLHTSGRRRDRTNRHADLRSVKAVHHRVALAVPCYVDQLRPQAAQATLTLLERLGCEVDLRFDAPCCGQPMSNAGAVQDARAAAARWAASSQPFEAIVMPSGSCTYHVRHQLPRLATNGGAHAARVTYELCEFLAGPLARPRLSGRFPYRVAMHLGCHAQRGLRLGSSTELHQAPAGVMRTLLASLEGITLVPLTRSDECCGFGGSFAVGEPELSVAMGRDRLRDATQHAAEVLVSSDPSCLLHLEGIARAQGTGLRVMHIAELLEEATR